MHDKAGYEKIRRCAARTTSERLDHFWVDTCCIDKTSSAELSEAINSMYRWYAEASVCFAYLADVPHDEDIQNANSRFHRSEWWSRGWTLQELIAPRCRLEFPSNRWSPLGTKMQLTELVSEITSVPQSVLKSGLGLHTPYVGYPDHSVAQIMSWAAKRRTSRAEDVAYCLLGLFGVHMPLLYGEGKRNAFVRLQLEIMRTSPDHTIFAWEHEDEGSSPFTLARHSMLAGSPTCFQSTGRSRPARPPATWSRSDRKTRGLRNQELLWPRPQTFAMTNLGLEINLPIIPYAKFPARHRSCSIEEPCALAVLSAQEDPSLKKPRFLAVHVYKIGARNQWTRNSQSLSLEMLSPEELRYALRWQRLVRPKQGEPYFYAI